jgi:hypothetical protein
LFAKFNKPANFATPAMFYQSYKIAVPTPAEAGGQGAVDMSAILYNIADMHGITC